MAAARTGILCLSGFNLRAVVALCRYGQGQGVPVHLAARGPADPLLRTAHAARVFTVRSSPALQLDELCGWVRRLRREHGHERILLAPSTEFFNRFALAHREALADCGAVLPLVEAPLYEAVSDKQAFGAMCRRHGIGVPQEQATPPARLPFVAKPIRYAGADGRQLRPHLVLQPADLARFQAEERAEDFYFQEYVQGQSLYLLLYLPRRGPAVRWSQENLLQQARGGSIILARRSDFHTHPEADRYVDMLRAEGFFGLVMVEVRRCPDTGRCVMIEANPRMWGPMQFVQDNGVDLFGALLRDMLDETPAPLAAAPVSGEFYYWSGGLVPASRPYAFHGGYDASRLLDEHARVAACDLFLRDDTLALHRHEMCPETSP